MAYDDHNIFAKILRGEAPAHIVFEDANSVAFMDFDAAGGRPHARDPARARKEPL